MPATAPTRLTIDPPIDQWRVTPRSGRTTPVIATGHQPTLWHPGILTKYLAADAFAQRVGGKSLQVVVEHNAIETSRFELPQQRGDTLVVRACQLAPSPRHAALPPNVAEPICAGFAIDRLEDEASVAEASPAVFVSTGLRGLAEAFDAVGDQQASHAQQMAGVLDHLKRPYLHRPMTRRTTSELVTPKLVERMLADPIGCVRCYNRAARAFPEAGIRPLYLGRDVVETPLWAQDRSTCTPVYIDLGDSKRPQLFTTQHNRHLDLTGLDALQHLRPRAVTLSALMRSEHCDLFIHGAGGGVYDQVTERWWHDWTGEALAPMAVVSADLFLPFEAPVKTLEQLRRATWFAHHLPHNLDRNIDHPDTEEAALIREKHDLLDRMHDDRSKRRRSAAFQRIHAINAELQTRHHREVEQAKQAAEQARAGVANAAIAARRDWCFALYPEQALKSLRDQLAVTA